MRLFFYISIIFIQIIFGVNCQVNKKLNEMNKIFANLEKFKKAIVTIISKTDNPFISEIEEIVTTTGFVIDINKLLILTIKKAARMSPSTVKVQFYNGKIVNGKVIYSDIRLPFGIIQINKNHFQPKELSSYSELKFGSTQNNRFSLYSPVLMIGITPKGVYMVKTGNITKSNLNLSSRYGSIFQTSLENVTNLKGCPVFNQNGEVIGMHLVGNKKSSYELKIDYVTHVLESIRQNKDVLIGDIGIDIELIDFKTAIKNYRLSVKKKSKNQSSNKKISSKLMAVSNVIEGSPAYGFLIPGDIILKVNDEEIGDDLLLLDQMMNRNVQKEIDLEISRNGDIFLQTINVQNVENYRINQYLVFNGGYFHNINPFTKWYLNNSRNGIYLSYVSQGSPFCKVVSLNQNSKSNFLLTRINSNEIISLDNFVEFLKENCDNNSFYLEGIDFNLFAGKSTSSDVDFDSSNNFIFLIKYNSHKKRWIRRTIDLSKNCFPTKKKKKSHLKTKQKGKIKNEHKMNNTIVQKPNNNKTLNKNPVITKKEYIKPVIKTNFTSTAKLPPLKEKSNDFNEDDNDSLFEDENPVYKTSKSFGVNEEYEIDFNSEEDEKMKRKSLFLKNPRLLKNHINKPVQKYNKIFRSNISTRNNTNNSYIIK